MKVSKLFENENHLQIKVVWIPSSISTSCVVTITDIPNTITQQQFDQLLMLSIDDKEKRSCIKMVDGDFYPNADKITWGRFVELVVPIILKRRDDFDD